MTARQKIEGLTNAWYGYVTFSALASLFRDGLPGVFSILLAAFGLGLSLALTWFIGRRLLAKSALTRFILLCVTLIGSVGGAFGVAKATWLFVQTWQLGLLGVVFFGGVSVYMHTKSFRTLTDASVRAYFN